MQDFRAVQAGLPRWVLWLVLCAAVEAADSTGGLRRVCIGVASDGPSWYSDQLEELVRQELALLTAGEIDVAFKKDPAFDAGWDLALIPDTLQAALNDPEVDLVLVLGSLTTEAAARRTATLSKPVLSGFVQDADTLDLHYDEQGRSTMSNFTFVVMRERATSDLQMFYHLLGREPIHILLDAKLLEGLHALRGVADRFEEKLGLDLAFLPMNELAEETLSLVDDRVHAVYLTPPLRMPPAEQAELIAALTERRIPTFSLMGRPDVENGVLAGLAPECSQRMARRIALNLQQIMLGASPNELPVYLPSEDHLVLNARTAVRVGYAPDFDTLLKADVLFEDELDPGEPLVLEEALRKAAAGNVDLDLRRAEQAAARAERRQARSAFLPQVSAGGKFYEIDEDRAAASGGFEPEQRLTAGLSVSQLLYDDSVAAAFRSSGLNARRAELDLESTRLETLAAAGARFLDLLSARALMRIEIDNLKLTQSNLEIAKVRQQVGTSGPEEVYRFEADEARQRSSVIEAEAHALQAGVALNQALGLDQRKRWKPQDIALADTDYYFLGERLQKVVDNQRQLDAFREFSVVEALANSPVLQGLDLAVAIQRIQLGQLRREGWLPALGAQFSYDHVIDEQFAGLRSTPAPADVPDDTEWVLGLTVALPLFEGGGRRARVSKAGADLEATLASREKARQQLELQARGVVYRLQSSQPNIRLSRLAADRAEKNLEVVRDKYARGSVSIIDLLDAQNQALVQRQTAALAVHEYLGDLMEYQRVISWFEIDHSEEEKNQWLERFTTFAAGLPPP